jgi:hypothetical protein
MKILLGLHPQKIVKSTGVFEEIFVVIICALSLFFEMNVVPILHIGSGQFFCVPRDSLIDVQRCFFEFNEASCRALLDLTRH